LNTNAEHNTNEPKQAAWKLLKKPFAKSLSLLTCRRFFLKLLMQLQTKIRQRQNNQVITIEEKSE